MSQICIPCYAMLHKILPHTEAMYQMAMKNLERWKLRAQVISNKCKNDDNESIETCGDEDDPLSSDEPEEDVKNSLTEEKNEETLCDDAELVKGPKEETTESFAQTTLCSTTDISSIAWEEEDSTTEAIAESVERLSAGFYKSADGVEWIDEEGVVVKSNALKGVIKNVGEQ